MASTNNFLGLNAMEAYEKKVKATNFSISTTVAQVYAKGSKSYNAIVNGMNKIEHRLDENIVNLVKAYEDRMKEQTSIYQNNDDKAGTQIATNVNNMMKKKNHCAFFSYFAKILLSLEIFLFSPFPTGHILILRILSVKMS